MSEITSLPEVTAKGSFLKLYLCLISFLSGAVVMVIEIAGNRFLAPVFGNSIYTWTALIGIVLAAASLGGYLGGIYADRFPKFSLIGWMLLAAGGWTLLTPSLAVFAKTAIGPTKSLIVGPLLYCLVLFKVSVFFLGGISPFAIKIMNNLMGGESVGKSAGLIGMLGSLGSFVGTFLTGFYFLSKASITTIFLFVGVLLIVLGLFSFFISFSLGQKSFLDHKGKLISMIGCFVLFGGLSNQLDQISRKLDPSLVYQNNNFYHLIRVREKKVKGERHRILLLDSTREGAVNLDRDELVMDYQKFWYLARLLPELNLNKALFLGAGAYGLPIDLRRHYPEAKIDVVEIDPEVIKVGEKYFGLKPEHQINSLATDARMFLTSRLDSEKLSEGYDFIFADAYDGVMYIPPQLVTSEFFELSKASLSDNGLFMMNLVGTIKGPRSELLGHLLFSLNEVFPAVEVYSTKPGSPENIQNILLLASKSSLKEINAHNRSEFNYLTNRHISKDQLPRAPWGFTDSFNSIDAVIARQLGS